MSKAPTSDSRDLQEALQSQFDRQERLHESDLESFAFNFAHHTRNALGIIEAAAESLLQKPWITQTDEQARESIIRHCRQMLSRLEQMQDFCRPLALNFKIHDIGNILESTALTMEERCRAMKIRLKSTGLPFKTLVRADEKRLSDAILNVLVNSVEAMPAGGDLSLIAQTSRNRNCVDIKITDSGAGVRPEHQKLLGEPFFTTKAARLGLGLAITQRIIHAHQGQWQVESLLGQGTRMIIRLPLRVASCENT